MTRTELNRTETFLSRQADGREFLGAHLQGPLTKYKRWPVQFITNTFPNRLNLHHWKKADSNLCACGSVVETNATFNASAPSSSLLESVLTTLPGARCLP